MWMSEAPRFRESMRSTFESLMTGAASDDLREVAEVDLVVLGLDRLDVGLVVGHGVEVDLGEARPRPCRRR